MDGRQDLIGIGIYGAAEAGRLIGLPPATLRRWIAGYRYRQKGELHEAAPLWEPQVPRLSGEVEIGFRDLIELRFVKAFHDAGVSLSAIRMAIARAHRHFGMSHPFGTARFKTDGRTIFMQVLAEGEEPELLDLVSRQYAFSRIIAPSFKDIDLEDGVAARWWPMGRARSVLLDPARELGRPIVFEAGVPTRALAQAVRAEGSIELVARLFDVSRRAVQDSVAFEGAFAAEQKLAA